MKKIFKVIGFVLLFLIVVILIGALVVHFRGIPQYELVAMNYQVVSSEENIERGKKLSMMLCASCHMDMERGNFSGNRMMEAPKEFGEIYAPNITQHKRYGIGEWTDGELVYLLRTGIKRDGSYAPPYMAKLPGLADSDMNAIIAFLRSDDKLVAADPRPSVPIDPSFLTKVLCNIAWKPLPYPDGEIALPDESNPRELGRYLAHNLECFSCHSADFKTNDFLYPENSKGYFAGGNKPLDRDGNVVVTQNLTPDAETGIGNWTEEQFIRAVRFGIKEGEVALRYPMLPYSQLTDGETAAIFTYLKTLEPVKNNVPRSGL